MLFLLSLLGAALVAIFCSKTLKRRPVPFYLGAVCVSLAVVVCTWTGVRFPAWFSGWVWPVFARAGLSGALFVLVMFAGAAPGGSRINRLLMPIRGQLSILASILTLGHNIAYGRTYFSLLFANPSILPLNQILAAVCSIIMILILLPLFGTSFKAVRKRMNGKRWKQLQRLAYAFYGLMYLHVMLLNVPYALDGRSGYLFSVFLYSAVFLVYAICRVMKYLAVRNRQQAKLLRRQYIGTPCGVAAALLVLFCVSTTAQARSAANTAATLDGLTGAAARTVPTAKEATADAGAAE